MQLPSTQLFPHFGRSDRKHIIDMKRKLVFAALRQRIKIGGKLHQLVVRESFWGRERHRFRLKQINIDVIMKKYFKMEK